MNRKILDHLLHDAFSDDAGDRGRVGPGARSRSAAGADRRGAGQYGFRDVKQAYRNLMALAEEKIRFLSTRRCRHFLAAIAPPLLEAVAATRRPRRGPGEPRQSERFAGRQGRALGTLQLQPAQLAAVRRSLRLQPVPLRYPHQQPGHARRPDGQPRAGQAAQPRGARATRSSELCRAAEDIEPILHSFKNDQQLRVGVRDLLGKEDIQATTGGLVGHRRGLPGADRRRGEYRSWPPSSASRGSAEGPRAGEPCDMVILALGKFGGREMNYHSDLDIVFLYEADGHTAFDFGDCAGRKHLQPAFFQRAGPADHQGRQPA